MGTVKAAIGIAPGVSKLSLVAHVFGVLVQASILPVQREHRETETSNPNPKTPISPKLRNHTPIAFYAHLACKPHTTTVHRAQHPSNCPSV